MHLKREVLSVNRVKKVKSDGEFLAESVSHTLSEKLIRTVQRKIHCGGLHGFSAEVKRYAVFFRNSVKAPRVVASVVGQVKMGFHPVSAPNSGVKVGNKSERLS